MSNQFRGATKLIAENARLRKLAEQNEQAADALWAERDRLREAIEAHRRDMWGDEPTDHQHDNRLYAALQEAGDE